MRIISQDEMIDVPYEQCVLMVDKYGVSWGLMAVLPGIEKTVCLGTFERKQDCINELSVIEDNYYKKERLYQVWGKQE